MYPWIARNIVFPMHEAVKRHRTLNILRQMEAADRLSAADLSGLRLERLREFLGYCHAHVPLIRKQMAACGLDPSRVASLTDLERLPLMTKTDMREHRSELRSDIAHGLVPFTTGGSTGEPLIFDLAKRRVAARVACRQRVSRWFGVSVGDPEIALWGSPIEVSRQDRLRALRDRLLASRLLSAFEMNEATMTHYLDMIERRRWGQMFGYPSAVHLLCLEARKQGRDLRRLGWKAAFVTGEVLYPYQRELISDVLGCPVANGYGGRDSGFVSHECPRGGMHILADAIIVEIIGADGRGVREGESGEIVVTDLYSHEAPFIRYRTGDQGALSTVRCDCGRALPLLQRIDGRSNDCVVAPDGRIINALALIYPVREVPGIEQFRIWQRQPDAFEVKIVRTPEFPPDGEYRIRQSWAELLRTPLRVAFEYVAQLPAEPSGKFRHVITSVSAGRRSENANRQ